jgi:hypothetical protein
VAADTLVTQEARDRCRCALGSLRVKLDTGTADPEASRCQVPVGGNCRLGPSWPELHGRDARGAGRSVHLTDPASCGHGPWPALGTRRCGGSGQGLCCAEARRPGSALHVCAGLFKRGNELPARACGPDPGCAEAPPALSCAAHRSALPRFTRHPLQHPGFWWHGAGHWPGASTDRQPGKSAPRHRRPDQSHQFAALAGTKNAVVQPARLSGPVRHTG